MGKVYVPGKGWRPRDLYHDPLTGQTLLFPQPLKSRHACWFSQWRSSLQSTSSRWIPTARSVSVASRAS
eukprot:6180126-Pleurochrysis_carterae.AAC.1